MEGGHNLKEANEQPNEGLEALLTVKELLLSYSDHIRVNTEFSHLQRNSLCAYH